MADDYYEVLGIPRAADAAEIQQAFRTLARRYHPDVNRDPAAEERFKQINEAYSVLSDPDTIHAFEVTLIATGIAVPLNTVFGVLCGLAIVRRVVERHGGRAWAEARAEGGSRFWFSLPAARVLGPR